MKSIFNGVGSMLVDNRCSGGKLEEDDLLGCKHCPKPIKRKEWKEEGAFCHSCDGPLCKECAKIPGCTPELKKLEASINDFYRREQNAKILGV